MRLCLAVFILLLISAYPVATAGNEDKIPDNASALIGSRTTLIVITSSGNVTEGDEFIIDISIKPVEPVYGLELKITFDSSLIEGVNLEKGEFLGGSQVVNTINNESGEMSYAETKVGNVKGSLRGGVIARATFKAKKSGNTTIRLEDIKLVNDEEKLISDVINNNLDLMIRRVSPKSSANGFLTSLIVFGLSILWIKRAR